MKILLILIITFSFIGCNTPSSPQINNKIEQIKPTLEEEPILTHSTEDTLIEETYPSPYCIDSSWHVYSDIQEGFFMSYRIAYNNRKDTTVSTDEESPAIGGVDHPEPYYLDSVTYLVPNVGGSPKGYYSLFIYKDGSHKYVENITVIENN